MITLTVIGAKAFGGETVVTHPRWCGSAVVEIRDFEPSSLVRAANSIHGQSATFLLRWPVEIRMWSWRNHEGFPCGST